MTLPKDELLGEARIDAKRHCDEPQATRQSRRNQK
jgi:hypothetical protein